MANLETSMSTCCALQRVLTRQHIWNIQALLPWNDQLHVSYDYLEHYRASTWGQHTTDSAININIGIVCMVKAPNTSQSIQSNASSYQGSETCNRQQSESDEIKVWKTFFIP